MATTDKYDRQLRLWGASGQRALGNTLVVLIGSSACGTETLKNLVLPGVGSILCVDDDDAVAGNGSTNGGANGDSAGVKAQSSPALTDSMLKFTSHSSNFFLPPPSNQDDGNTLSNAAQACALLSELNPDVHGYHHTVPSLEGVDYTSFLKTLMDNPPSSDADAAATPKKILVVAADQPSSVTLPLSHACHSHSIPLLVVRSYGLLGCVRIQTASPYHAIIEAKPSHRIPDLRLSAWPLFDGLKNVASSVKNLDEIEDSKDHSHVPFVVILLQALEKWRGTTSAPVSNDDPAARPRYPKSFAEKEAFRKVVRAMAKNISNEINFEEAVREAHLVWADGRISEDVKLVLERVDEESFIGAAIQSDMEVEGGSSSPKIPSHVLQFQLLALALKRFLQQNDDYPPLEGTIPDMTSDTTRYIALQEAYQQQAEKDRSALTEIVKSLLDECKQKSNGCDLHVSMPSDDEILTFCKNARYLRILETRPLYAEYKLQDPDSPVVSALSQTLSSPDMPNFETIQSDAREDLLMATMDPYETDPVHTPMLWWIALRACDAFYDRHQHYPGKHDQELALEADANEVYKCMVQIATSLGLAECDFIKEHLLDQAKGKDLAREVVRYDEAEIHNIAAVVGGVASQEAVKLITGQYVPFDDTYVYNGIASTAGVYRF
mmetsp:Transcript_9066/g.16572  ORF Transcript_9066/g.16572 Transcript_9066/m.16572 type:complete len:664 (-) Transcript_9066:104-2095(-)|eukprot:CAMPEP_0201910706 /NCGR_PEP_ID=MMETSP0903-20130614/1980_1 /ASSEMBLY_ACC=CAM_ASM_000552 /TAXON_ID=420261 /ORGANISM="Thalassiosira antarctica, Strain CCMP982" /LENGTH=663 /DNA_ID=CAMNT_0048445377 /DNA_START=59 /DNA_END=2050 /DNA_ORIENTATION=+